jgi:C1A family cysteine protease
MKHSYGWRADRPDFRDYIYKPRHIQNLPTSVDLRSGCPPVYDQGQLGSCTANAIAAALEFDQIKQGETPFTPSRLLIYYDERQMEGTVSSDSGAEIRDGVKSVNQQGACPESEWPYDISQFAVAPPAQCYVEAAKYKAVVYQAIPQDLDQMKACLADGYPFIFGISVYDSFESDTVAQTGVVPMPSSDESQLGGHAVLAVGYDDASQRFLVRNSWGPDWAGPMAGYFTIPYAYLTNSGLASDFWTIRSVS